MKQKVKTLDLTKVDIGTELPDEERAEYWIGYDEDNWMEFSDYDGM